MAPDRFGFRACIVDPDAERGRLIADVLRRNRFVVVPAGGDAPCDPGEPHAVQLLVLYADASGLELCRTIRRREKSAETYILVLLPDHDTERVDAAHEAGASEALPAPLVWSLFDRRVRQLHRMLRYERVHAESEARNDAFLKAIPDTIVIVDSRGENLRHVSGGDGTPFSFDDYPSRLVRSWKRSISQVVDSGEVVASEFGNGKGEERRFFEMRMARYGSDEVLMIIRDVTAQQRANARVYRLAFYDPLTGLPNRQSFMTRISEAIREAADTNGRFSILYLDLDNFKRVNDSLGHTIGDEILKRISRRIEDCVRADDMIARNSGGAPSANMHMARLGGDEFTVLLRGVNSPADADLVASRVTRAVSQPIVLEGREFVFTSSVGIVSYPEDGTDMDALIANADMAMYRAKDSGKNTVRSFSDTMSVRSLEYLELENELRQAIADRGLELHYQPKMSLSTGRITGFEALCRWNHVERGYISPAKFVRIAVEAGLILELGEWVLNEACRQLAAWQGSALDGLPVAINLSGKQFSQSDVHRSVLTALAKHRIRPQLLELELTESELMADANRTIVTLNKLKKAGLSIAVDDFGTGYSSLAYLKRFPIDALKIDQSFAMRPQEENDNFSICSAIIALAHSLKLKVIAEGVESEEHQRQLVALGCDEMQGYFLAKPQRSDELERFVADYRNRAAEGRVLRFTGDESA